MLLIIAFAIFVIIVSIKYIGLFLKQLAKLDAVVVVAIITGGVSIIGVVISSIVGKSLEYKKSRNEYLAQKREGPYCDFVDLIYKVQQNGKAGTEYPQEDMIKDINKFSKQLTLWGSPKVAKKWIEFRQLAINPKNNLDSIWITEEIMNEMRKDLGTGKTKKGQLMGFIINDIKDYIKQK